MRDRQKEKKLMNKHNNISFGSKKLQISMVLVIIKITEMNKMNNRKYV